MRITESHETQCKNEDFARQHRAPNVCHPVRQAQSQKLELESTAIFNHYMYSHPRLPRIVPSASKSPIKSEEKVCFALGLNPLE